MPLCRLLSHVSSFFGALLPLLSTKRAVMMCCAVWCKKLGGRSRFVRSKLVLEDSWLILFHVYSKSLDCLPGRCRHVVALSRWWLPVAPSRFTSLMQMVGGIFPHCFLCNRKETIELTDTWLHSRLGPMEWGLGLPRSARIAQKVLKARVISNVRMDISLCSCVFAQAVC